MGADVGFGDEAVRLAGEQERGEGRRRCRISEQFQEFCAYERRSVIRDTGGLAVFGEMTLPRGGSAGIS